MFQFFKKSVPSIYSVSYRFDGENTVYTETATSAGLASLNADAFVEILEVVKI